MATKQKVFARQELSEFVRNVFVRAGLREADADLVGENLIISEMRGVKSHGLMRIPAYLKRIQAGLIDPAAQPEVVLQAGSVAVVDGRGAMGQVVGARSMAVALELAREFGISFVTAGNSNHFGTAGFFAEMAARAGMVGMAGSNASPTVAPWGGMYAGHGHQPCGRGDSGRKVRYLLA